MGGEGKGAKALLLFKKNSKARKEKNEEEKGGKIYFGLLDTGMNFQNWLGQFWMQGKIPKMKIVPLFYLIKKKRWLGEFWGRNHKAQNHMSS